MPDSWSPETTRPNRGSAAPHDPSGVLKKSSCLLCRSREPIGRACSDSPGVTLSARYFPSGDTPRQWSFGSVFSTSLWSSFSAANAEVAVMTRDASNREVLLTSLLRRFRCLVAVIGVRWFVRPCFRHRWASQQWHPVCYRRRVTGCQTRDRLGVFVALCDSGSHTEPQRHQGHIFHLRLLNSW